MNFPPRIALDDFNLIWPQPRLAAAYAQALNESYAEHRPFLGWARPHTTLEEARDSLTAARATFTLATGEKRYFLVQDDEVLGCLGLTPNATQDRLLVGYWLATRHQGRGYMTRALRYVAEVRGAVELWLTTSAANGPSQRVAERVGFVRTRVLPDDRPHPDGGRCASYVYTLAGDRS